MCDSHRPAFLIWILLYKKIRVLKFSSMAVMQRNTSPAWEYSYFHFHSKGIFVKENTLMGFYVDAWRTNLYNGSGPELFD